MRHAQTHIAPVAIFQPRHVIADRRPTPTALPQFGGVDNGQGYFLTINSVHFSPKDIFNFLFDSPAQG